jgi:hypothetical protein
LKRVRLLSVRTETLEGGVVVRTGARIRGGLRAESCPSLRLVRMAAQAETAARFSSYVDNCSMPLLVLADRHDGVLCVLAGC